MTDKGKLAVSLLVGVLLTGAGQGVANAADVAADVQEPVAQPVNEWRYAIAPYLWAAGMSGDVGLFGLEPVHLDMSFGDIFDELRFGGMLVAEAHNGTWGVMGDFIYANTKSDTSFVRNAVALDASVETSSFTGTVMGEYRAYMSETVSVDLMAGARIWSVDNDINAALAADGSPVAEWSGSDGATWVDPMIGLKARFNTSTPWFFNAWGMIGTGSSDISWDVLGGVGYQWTDKVSLVGGYRALGVDYNDDGFVYDIVQQGPYMGAIFSF